MIGAAIEEFARQLVGDDASQAEMDLAIAAAEAQFDVARVRQQRQLVLEREVLLHDELPSPRAIEGVIKIDGYERRALARRKRALSKLSRLCRLPVFK